MTLKELKQKALEAIDEVFCDTSETKETNVEALEDLKDHIEMHLDVYRNEL